jgi:geranylgeranyl diphosphate synthase type II
MTQLKKYQQLIEEGLKQIPMQGKPAELYDPIRYVLALGGKRMRPVLTLLACDLFDGNVLTALDAALAIELFHNFTLVHDDIMDKAPLRRGQPSVHEKWNQDTAILSGDAMLIKAYQQLSKTQSPRLSRIVDIFNETALRVCEGQQLDMNYEKKNQVSIASYLHMIELKTAVLLAGSLEIGALLGGAREEDARHLANFGKSIGIAFQLQDDILDVYGDAQKFGKQPGGDIIANKKTFLLLKALEVSAQMPYKQEELKQWIFAPHFEPLEKVSAVTAIYDYLDIRKLARQEMESQYNKAMSHLSNIPGQADKKAGLIALTDSLMSREV